VGIKGRHDEVKQLGTAFLKPVPTRLRFGHFKAGNANNTLFYWQIGIVGVA
jgi:hypothetical protein